MSSRGASPRHRGAGSRRHHKKAAPLRGLAAVAAAALVPAIAGCEAGLNAPTLKWHQPTSGASGVVNNTIKISNMFVLGAPPGSALAAGESAGVFLALANTGPADRLIGISAPGVAASVRGPAGGVGLRRGQSVLLTGPLPQIVLENLTHSLGGGQFIKMVLDFQNAGTKTLSVPIMPRAQYYSTFSPAPSPSPTPTPAPTSRRHHKKAAPAPSPTSS